MNLMPFMSCNLSAAVNFPRVLRSSFCDQFFSIFSHLFVLFLPLFVFVTHSLPHTHTHAGDLLKCSHWWIFVCRPLNIGLWTYMCVRTHCISLWNWWIAKWKCIRCRPSGEDHTDFFASIDIQIYKILFFRLYLSAQFGLSWQFLYVSLSFSHLSKGSFCMCVLLVACLLASAMGLQRNYSKHFSMDCRRLRRLAHTHTHNLLPIPFNLYNKIYWNNFLFSPLHKF